jgi:hypothetical protein
MARSDERLGRSARNAFVHPVFWLVCGLPMVLCLLAFVASWPLGPGFIDEGGVTKVRLAVALIAFALFWGITLGGVLVVDALRRLTEVSERGARRA